MSKKRNDDAELWLRANDPEYATRKKAWKTPSTDALERDRHEHESLRSIHTVGKVGHGSYQKFPINTVPKLRKFEEDLKRKASPDEDSPTE